MSLQRAVKALGTPSSLVSIFEHLIRKLLVEAARKDQCNMSDSYQNTENSTYSHVMPVLAKTGKKDYYRAEEKEGNGGYEAI